jgi:hypothetical protein
MAVNVMLYWVQLVAGGKIIRWGISDQAPVLRKKWSMPVEIEKNISFPLWVLYQNEKV